MTTLRKDFIAGNPGYPEILEVPGHYYVIAVNKGSPGNPGRAAWDETVSTTTRSANGTVYIGIDENGQPFSIFVADGTFTYTTINTIIHHPAEPGYPPTPDTYETIWIDGTHGHPGGPAVVANYYPGWNSGATSIPRLLANGYCTFSVGHDCTGVVTGLNDASFDVYYIEIDHGLYFNLGKFRVMEKGVAKTAFAAYATTDVFAIARLGTQIRYYKNFTPIYTSSLPSVGAMMLDASLYFGGDFIS